MTQIGIDRWLSVAGFNGNPFASYEAGSETLSILNEYFVAPPYFFEVLGEASSPQSAIVFAPRGGGKTAQRVMLDYHCRRQLTQGRVLSVLYTDFTSIVEACSGDLSKVTSRCHILEVLRRLIPAFCNYLLENPISQHFIQLPEFEKLYLRWFISTYSNYLSPLHINSLNSQGIKLLHLKDDKTILIDVNSEKIPYEIAKILDGKIRIPPADMLSDLSGLLHLLDFDAIYVLVDCVDEFLQTGESPNKAVDLIEPLIADLRIMDLPRVAFKIFLPQELDILIQRRPAIRRDRLIFRRIEWNEKVLSEVLHRRLVAFSKHSSMDALCVPELRGRIEKEMITIADGSPRNLIRFGALLISEHSESSVSGWEDEWRITERALEAAKNHFGAEKIPQWGASQTKLSDFDEDDVAFLIKKGENYKLEFKASARWDLKANKPDNEIELIWLKTLVAFLNTEGGTLLIGVEDNGSIIGIEKDSFKNDDKCLIYLSNSIKQHIGLEFSKYIHFEIKKIDEKKIIIINCEKSKIPAFLKNDKSEEFCIRSGSSSITLSPSQTLEYLKSKIY